MDIAYCLHGKATKQDLNEIVQVLYGAPLADQS